MTQQEQFDWQSPGRYSQDTIKTAHLTVDGFDVTVKVVYDYDHDWTQFRGTFTDKWQEGVIKNPSFKYERHRVFEYFLPDNTLKEHLKSLLKMGYTAQVARKEAVRYVKEDMAIATDPDSSNLIAVGITVTCSLKGVELGEDSLWGTEVDYSDEGHEIDSTAREVLSVALQDAKKNLAALKAE